MAVPAYGFNGGSEIPGVISTWKQQEVRQNDDGTIDYSPYAINRWQAAAMSMANFETFRTAQGSQLDSLETNDIDNRNTGKAYTDVFIGLVNGEQNGLQATGITIEFLVNVS